MAFYLNEISIHNQFHDSEHFLNSLRLLWGCKELLHRHQYALNCTRSVLGNRPVMNDIKFRSVIGNLQDRNIQRAILRWVDQDGPFWDDDQVRLHSPDEYFSCSSDEIVTDTALAEAAYLAWMGHDTALVSFAPSDYLKNPLLVSWYKTSYDKVDIYLDNYWDYIELGKWLATMSTPLHSWAQMFERVRAEFTNLVFLTSFETGFNGLPFNSTIADHAIRLLAILNELKGCFDCNGERTPRGHEIYQDFFTGGKAKFSDESDTNKVKFEKELTFEDLDGNPIFCPFHGKISYQSYRLHFSWPITRDGILYITYLGPKITKG